MMHDTPEELAQPYGVKAWWKGECEAIPGLTMPNMVVVERDYPNTYKRFTSLGPLLEKLGNGGKGIKWDTKEEVEFLGKLNRIHHEEGAHQGRPKIESAIDACEVILSLAPETNGHVAVKAWDALSKITGRDHTHLAKPKEEEKSASTILWRNREKLFLHLPGRALKTNTSPTTRATPTCMN